MLAFILKVLCIEDVLHDVDFNSSNKTLIITSRYKNIDDIHVLECKIKFTQSGLSFKDIRFYSRLNTNIIKNTRNTNKFKLVVLSKKKSDKLFLIIFLFLVLHYLSSKLTNCMGNKRIV